jgi:branched-chain amino acid aminotransferase
MNFNMAELETGDVDKEAFPILLDQEGNVTEGTINSVFIVKNGVIKTPGDSEILQSESRSSVVELADALGIPCLQEDVQPYDLYTADETFLAFTGPGVLPMTQVDKRDIADGKPGPITQQLVAALSEKVGVDIPGQAQRFARS